MCPFPAFGALARDKFLQSLALREPQPRMLKTHFTSQRRLQQCLEYFREAGMRSHVGRFKTDRNQRRTERSLSALRNDDPLAPGQVRGDPGHYPKNESARAKAGLAKSMLSTFLREIEGHRNTAALAIEFLSTPLSLGMLFPTRRNQYQ